jgi:hypothetical protein
MCIGRFRRTWFWLSLLLLAGWQAGARGEAMLQLFNVSWPELIKKMPEIAEAGYDSLWLPPPAKAGSVYSVGYDLFDPFDLGDQNQRGTIPTRYGTKAQLVQMVQVAHRFGIRVYFDNVMNHRGFDVPGFNSSTPTNLYPAMVPQDFHLQTVSGGFYQNWPGVQDWCNAWDVQNESLSGLVDIANEPGTVNGNFGPALGNTTPKLSFIRQPTHPEYYMDPSGPSLGGPWRPFNGTNGVPSAEDVNSYLIRAAMWMLYTTKCDGFRLDAVKHVPWQFFGASSANPTADDPTFSGYTGGIQAMYDYVHGYGSNVTGNGYVETDGNRNSLFDTEAPRNDAMIFGEHISPPPPFQDYLNAGMRLLNQPLYNQMNSALGGYASLSGMDGRDYAPGSQACQENGIWHYYPCFSAAQSVMFAQDQDQAGCCATHRELQNAYYFMHEGLSMIYANNYNNSTAPAGQFPFPNNPDARYLGEFGDPLMPDICYVHNQLARGGTWSRWSDNNIVAFERYDYREGSGSNPQDQDVVLFVMNDNFGYPGDIEFDDGVSRVSDGYYSCANGSPSRGLGLVVGFPPGSVLAQLSSTAPGGNRACPKLLVHYATQNKSEAISTANDPNPINRKIYVGGQTLAPNGGAVELLAPSGGWVMYGYQWPEPSRANALTNAITFRQGGAAVPTIRVYRHDGANGDPSFNPLYPFKMRGSVDPYGNVVTGANVSNLTYAIDVPVLTNAPFDIVVRSDASSVNTLVRLDGGIDLNSQMGLGPASGPDLRDNKPGYATDVFLGYEQTAFDFRNGPEKFAARNVLSNNIVSLGAETYCFTVGGSSTVAPGSGSGQGITNQTANWVWHDPTNGVTSQSANPPAQRNPLNPSSGQAVDVWVKVGYQFQINTCYIYYTTDGTNPEGAFGAGKGTTQVVQAGWVNHDSAQSNIDWWRGTIPSQADGTQVLYKVALFYGGSVYRNQSIQPISNAEPSGSKFYGLTESAITNFNPTTALVWLHNDLNTNNTAIGLQSGFHIVRARTFLPRSGKSSVYNTFVQTFYYDGQLPGGVIAYPASDGSTITGTSYQVVVRADANVTEVDYTIQDSYGQTNGVAAPVTPDPSLSQQNPNYPQEFRFNYSPVPSSGTATITVQLKDLATSAYPNRLTTLARTVNTAAPAQVVNIASPATDGSLLLLYPSNNYSTLLQSCFTSTLTVSDSNLFSIYINGLFQPRSGYIFRPSGCGAGMRALYYNWTNAPSGTNTIQIIYTNLFTLSATRTVTVARYGDPTDSDGDGVPDWMELLAGTNPYDPNSVLRITALTPGTPVALSWSSVPGKTYQVLATTNLAYPMIPVPNGLVPAKANASSTEWFDPAPDAANRFYRIQLQQ